MNDLLHIVPLIGLYAETHYRFRFFPFSLYYRREPEIVFDAPYRIEPGSPLPITLLIKDAYRFPIELEEVSIAIFTDGNRNLTNRFPINRPLDCTFYYQIFDLDVSALPAGPLSVVPTLAFRLRGKQRQVHVDNFPGLNHKPLAIRKAADPLPLPPGWIAGELHCHTSYGPDQVEFSAPLEVIKRNASAMGLHFSALTDHSYNLDDLQDDYLHQDPDLIKWELLQEESARLNRAGGAVLLPGEELSCRSSSGRNVHMLIIGNREFIHGGGDGAEKWFSTRSEYSLEEALRMISPDAFVVAAHPLVPTPLLEWLLVGRGEWQEDDLARERLDGWQIVNGDWGVDFQKGYDLWRKALLQGKHIMIYGGNDAHGNFNRFRQVQFPMIRLREDDKNIFGRITTRIKTDERSARGIIQALKKSPSQISDGPSLEVNFNPVNKIAHIRWYSTEEFGTAEEVRIYSCTTGRLEHEDHVTIQGSYLTGEIYRKIIGDSLLTVDLIVKTHDGREHRAIINCPDPM